jgi:hypothetical protein
MYRVRSSGARLLRFGFMQQRPSRLSYHGRTVGATDGSEISSDLNNGQEVAVQATSLYSELVITD